MTDVVNIYNPISESCSVVIDGRAYVVGAGEVLRNISREDAQKWQTNTHQFLVIQEVEAVAAAPVVEATVEVIKPTRGKK